MNMYIAKLHSYAPICVNTMLTQSERIVFTKMSAKSRL